MTDELNPNPTTSSPTSSTTPPQPNEPGARSPDGTILDVSASPSVSESVQSNSPAQPNAGAPESYSDFSVPDGVTLDPSLVSEVTPIFKELGLDQTAAQRLVEPVGRDGRKLAALLLRGEDRNAISSASLPVPNSTAPVVPIPNWGLIISKRSIVMMPFLNW